jgi:ubiquinone biosynthesis protein
MTLALVHMWRLARWGRTLGRHGALRGIERDRNAPPAIRRLARLARFGITTPAVPAYAAAFESMGPAAIKLGQALATRPDLIGEAAAHDLMRLQDQLPAVPFAAIEASLREAFDQPIESLFASIDRVAVGAASIAQVHRAVTSDGRDVAIKVLRPDIEATFASALETYEWAAVRVEQMGGEAARLRPRAILANFRRWSEAELNLRLEAGAASELAEAMASQTGFIVPKIDWDRTTRRAMTLEWIDGVRLTDAAGLAAIGADRKKLASTLVSAFLQQAIGDGFFHADLHQGNLFACADGRIAVIDFGIMGRLDRRSRVYLAEIIHGLLTGNYQRVAEIHFEAGYVPAHHNVGEFATALRAVGEPIRGVPVKDISIGNMLDGLFAITRTFDMATQPHLLLLQKTMVMVEGVAAALDPDVNMWEIATPFVETWMLSEMGPEARVADSLIRSARMIGDLPDFIRRVMSLVPLEGAAPPQAPLPELPVRTARPWGLVLGTLAIGLALGLSLAAALN